MRIKLLILMVAVVTQLIGISAQGLPGEKPTSLAETQVGIPLISVTSLSDTEGVDFNSYLTAWKKTSGETWEKLITSGAQGSFREGGRVIIRFKLLPSGEVMGSSMVLEERSGSTAFDRTVWSALTNSKYAALPSQFRGPYLELRTAFSSNPRPKM